MAGGRHDNIEQRSPKVPRGLDRERDERGGDDEEEEDKKTKRMGDASPTDGLLRLGWRLVSRWRATRRGDDAARLMVFFVGGFCFILFLLVIFFLILARILNRAGRQQIVIK